MILTKQLIKHLEATTNLNMITNSYEVVQNTRKLSKMLSISETFLTKCDFSLDLCGIKDMPLP